MFETLATFHMSALTRCLHEEASAISAAADRLSSDQLDAALLLLERCADRKAKFVITGVGKSGIVARKIAATFSSIGLMALYLNPLDALHGDLGVVAPDDVCRCQSAGSTSRTWGMAEREKYSARSSWASRVFTTFGLSTLSGFNP